MIRILRAALDGFKYIMNGAHLPNAAKLLIILCILMLIFMGQFMTAGSVVKAQRAVAWRQAYDMALIRDDIANMRVDLQVELQSAAFKDSTRSRRLERKIEITNQRIDDMNENGTDATNARIDELIRTLRMRRPTQR